MVWIVSLVRGEKPFWLTFWVQGILVLLFLQGMDLALDKLESIVSPDKSSPGFLLGSLLFYYLVHLGAITWWLLGSWRSSSKSRQGGLALTVACRIPVVAVLVGICITYYFFVVPQLRAVLDDLLSDPQWGTTVVKYSDVDRSVRITGPITQTAAKTFAAVNSEHRHTRIVILDSNGGRLDAARQISKDVRSRLLDTRVDNECDSACTVIFLSGRHRQLGAHGRLGFHAFVGGNECFDFSEVSVGEFVGVSSAFLQRAYSCSISDIWYPSRAELKAAGVITA